MACYNSCYYDPCRYSCPYTNYMCSSASLTDPSGTFYYPCDGMKRLIYTSATVKPTMKLNITNTGSCALTVELSQSNAGVITPKLYAVNSGASLLITETNITNVYITGTLTSAVCYSSCYNSCAYSCNPCSYSCYQGASGNYSIS